MEIIQLSPETFEAISKKTGKSIDELKITYEVAKADDKIIIWAIDTYRINKKDLNRCYYHYKWRQNPTHGQNLGRWICVVHNQESKYHVDDTSGLPCLGVDPYP